MPVPTPDPSAVTNYINTTKSLMDWVEVRLTPAVSSSWGLYHFSGTNYALLFDYVKTIKVTAEKPALVTVYTSSQYGFVPRRTATFSVLILSKNPATRDTAQEDIVDLMDTVIGLLDNQIYNHMVVHVARDQGIDLPGTELNCQEVGFIFLDH